jgi:hypothetical protein
VSRSRRARLFENPQKIARQNRRGRLHAAISLVRSSVFARVSLGRKNDNAYWPVNNNAYFCATRSALDRRPQELGSVPQRTHARSRSPVAARRLTVHLPGHTRMLGVDMVPGARRPARQHAFVGAECWRCRNGLGMRRRRGSQRRVTKSPPQLAPKGDGAGELLGQVASERCEAEVGRRPAARSPSRACLRNVYQKQAQKAHFCHQSVTLSE